MRRESIKVGLLLDMGYEGVIDTNSMELLLSLDKKYERVFHNDDLGYYFVCTPEVYDKLEEGFIMQVHHDGEIKYSVGKYKDLVEEGEIEPDRLLLDVICEQYESLCPLNYISISYEEDVYIKEYD